MTTDPEPAAKPKRKRKTRAERQAQAAAQATAAAKPIDPVIWIIVGAGILFFAFWTWADPVTFASAGQNPSIFQLIPVVMIRIFGQTPAVIILTVLGGVPLVFGVIGWLRKRFGKAD